MICYPRERKTRAVELSSIGATYATSVRETLDRQFGRQLLIFFEPWIGLLLYALIGRPTMPRSQGNRVKKRVTT